MVEKEYLQKRFTPPPPPEMLQVITGEELLLEERTDVFFQETAAYLEILPEHVSSERVQRVLYNLAIPIAADDGDSEHFTDQHVTLLLVGDIPVVSAMHVRGDMNYVTGVWASYLTPKVEEVVRRNLSE